MTPEWKAEVPTLDLLNRMVTDPLPLGLSAGPVEPFFQRDIYFDSADWTLRRRGVSCRFRIRVDDRRILTLRTIGRWEGGVPLVLPQTFEADVPELEGAQALVGTSDPARRLRSLIDPALLLPRIQFETERRVRRTKARWFSRGRYDVVYDVVTVRSHQMAVAFEELKLQDPGVELDQAEIAVQEVIGLWPVEVGNGGAQRILGQSHPALAYLARCRRFHLAGARPIGEHVRPRRDRERGEGPRVAQRQRPSRGEQILERQPLHAPARSRTLAAGDPPRQPHLEHGSRTRQSSRCHAEEAYQPVRAPEKGAQDLAAGFLPGAASHRQREGARFGQHGDGSPLDGDDGHLVTAARDLRQGAAFEIA